MFKKLIYCADCGKAMNRRHVYSRKAGGRAYYYSYQCVTSQKLPDACTPKNLMESELLPVVSNAIHRHMDTITALEKRVSKEYQEAHRRQFELDRWFSGYFCCEDYGFQPKEDIFPLISAQFPGQYLVIGDRESDFKVAQAYGLKSIGCGYGFGTQAELSMASIVVRSCRDIPYFIKILS